VAKVRTMSQAEKHNCWNHTMVTIVTKLNSVAVCTVVSILTQKEGDVLHSGGQSQKHVPS
jgi:hypothetical protein